MSKLLINVSKRLFLLVGNENMILSDKDVREQIQLNKIIVNGFDPNREPYRVCRRVNILRDYPDDKIKIYP